MGYVSKLQIIERSNQTRQFYLICPAPLAEALELSKGEEIEWIIEDKATLVLKRPGCTVSRKQRTGNGK